MTKAKERRGDTETRRRGELPGGQTILFEAESDGALLMPDAERAKRFTAAQARKISERLDLILALMACRLPLDEIARKAHVSTHTLRELGALYASQIAGDMGRYAGWASQLSAEFLWLARESARTSTPAFNHLIQAGSFIGKLSLDMQMASQQLKAQENFDAAPEAVTVNDRVEAMRKFLAEKSEAETQKLIK